MVSTQSNPINVSNDANGGFDLLSSITLTALAIGVFSLGVKFFAKHPNNRGLNDFDSSLTDLQVGQRSFGVAQAGAVSIGIGRDNSR